MNTSRASVRGRLALSHWIEAREPLRSTGLEISDEDVAELVRRTEGSSAGLYLAALSAGGTGVGSREAGELTGNDRSRRIPAIGVLRPDAAARAPIPQLDEHARAP